MVGVAWIVFPIKLINDQEVMLLVLESCSTDPFCVSPVLLLIDGQTTL